jgi:nucleoid-associated protein YgaU
MLSRKAIVESVVAAAIVLSCLATSPRSAGQGLQKQLETKYAITKPTDDKSDIVTAGSVLILQKDKLLMYAVSTQAPPQNTYSGGRLSAGAYAAHEKMQSFGSMIGHPPPKTIQTRYYVTGEKFWVTRIDALGDGVVFTLFTDAVQDVRYYCTLKFVYPHGTTPTSDQVLAMVGEVLKVQEDEPAKAGDQQQAAAGDANQQQAAPAADANQQQPAAEQAPAAPAAPPATVEIGQSTDQVLAILGQPEKIINLGPKQIYVYKDLKVTFVKGKVTDAQ